ncbi:MAG: hypothetical protein AAF564_16080 [Bacteroidota bacterium]
MPPAENTISKTNTSLASGLNFEVLRNIGLEQIRNLSGENWTDHNLHDPGITILEVLAYAMLDHGYRTGHKIEDLFARDASSDPSERLYYTAAEALGNNPVTVNDYRKLLLDIPGVRNAWLDVAEETSPALFLSCENADVQLKPVSPEESNDERTQDKKLFLNGLYTVSLELDTIRRQDQTGTHDDNSLSTDRILGEVRRTLFAHRNLSEDFVKIRVLQDEQIAFCAAIELDPGEIPEDVLTDMFVRLRDWLSPDPVFYTLQQLVAKGKTIEEIFEGRPLSPDSHGFVDLEELDAARPDRDVLYASDFYRVMLGESQPEAGPAIRAIRGLKLVNYINGIVQSKGEPWCLPLKEGYRPILDASRCDILCLKEGIPVSFDKEVVANRVRERLSNTRKKKLRPYELDRMAPEGIRRDLASYVSIQHDLPVVYGVGNDGLPDTVSATRKAQAFQLKGYLLFFDQLLANYLAQLTQVRQFFALRQAEPSGQTYFAGNIDSVPELDALVRGAGFNADGDQISGESIRVTRGQSVFYPENEAQTPVWQPCSDHESYRLFESPQLRNDTINRIIAAFEHENYTFEHVEDACKNNLIRFKIPGAAPDGATLTLLSQISFPEYLLLDAEAEALTFLFISPDYFRPVDLPNLGKYTFEIVYQPPTYEEVVARLAESPAAALNRRDRFLNHLLARFAEDFSDYALLQFSSGEQQTTQSLIRDKEQFLADYPVISERRSTGFDQTNKAEIWDSDNVTGLERRVGGLMGIGDWKRRTLAPFEVEKNEPGSKVAIRDFRGRALFKSPYPVEDHGQFLASVCSTAAVREAILPVDCPNYSRFGMALYENDGGLLARHPDYYADAALRDKKASYVSSIFAHPGGYDVRYTEVAGGWVFYLEKEDMRLAESVKAFEEDVDAKVAWVHFSTHAVEHANFEIVSDLHGVGYRVLVWNKDRTQVLGQSPDHFYVETEACERIEAIIDCLTKNRPQTKLVQDPPAWTWHLRGTDGELLLASCYNFAERDQASWALYRAAELVPEGLYILPPAESDAGWRIVLAMDNPRTVPDAIVLAEHPASFVTEEEAQEATDALCHAASPGTLYRGQIGAINRSYFYEWTGNDPGDILLKSTRLFASEEAAEAGLLALRSLAQDPENVRVDKENGYLVRVFDTFGDLIAEHPRVFLDEEEANLLANRIVRLARKKGVPASRIVTGPKVWFYRLVDQENEPIIKAVSLFRTRAEAHAKLIHATWHARRPNCWRADDSDGARVALTDDAGRKLAWSKPFINLGEAKNQELDDRDQMLALWRTWYGSENIPFYVHPTPGNWRFSVHKDEAIVLNSTASYLSEEEAALDLEKTLTFACNKRYLKCIQEPGMCRFNIGVYPSGSKHPLAVSPIHFPDKETCNKAAGALAAYLRRNKVPWHTRLVDTHYKYELFWETSDERIAIAFASTVQYADEGAAVSGFESLLASVDNLEVAPTHGERWGILRKDGDGYDAGTVHPSTYGSEIEAHCTLEDLKRYLRWGGWKFVQVTPGRQYRFRMLHDHAELATYSTQFRNEGERNEELKTVRDRLQRAGIQYTTLTLGQERVVREGNAFRYQLLSYRMGGCGSDNANRVLWTSEATFASQQAAAAAFDERYLDVLALAKDRANYRKQCDDNGNRWFYTLEDPQLPGQPIVRTEDLSDDLEEQCTALHLRLCHARCYPIVKQANRFCFRVGDPASNEDAWVSTHSYLTPALAFEAFYRFVELVAYPDNYYKVDHPAQPLFGFEVREAGLVEADEQVLCDPFGTKENPRNPVPPVLWYQRPNDTTSGEKLIQIGYLESGAPPDSPPMVSPIDIRQLDIWDGECCDENQQNAATFTSTADRAWQNLEQCAVGLDAKTNFSVFRDAEKQCRLRIQLVSENYRLARYRKVFHTHAERAVQRDCLFDTIASEVLCLPPKIDSSGNALRDTKRLYLDDVCSVEVWGVGGPRWIVRRDQLDPSLRVLEADDDRIESPINIEIMSLARAVDCYIPIQDESNPNAVRWGLFDLQNRLVATSCDSFEFEDETECEQWRNAAIADAWVYPYIKKGDKYGFQLARCVDDILLESVNTYAFPVRVAAAFRRLITLIREKEHYAPFESDDCGPFGIEIIDPAEIKATHPASFLNRESVAQAIDDLSNTMDAEGFHVVEHVLLRPATEKSRLFKLLCADCDDDAGHIHYDEHRKTLGVLSSDDPYSFKCTIVIPYWGRRFRNINFREYFEQTLRREAPTHIQLSIVWVTPAQMHLFESAWRDWLHTNAAGRDNCMWEMHLEALIDAMEKLQNAYPPLSRFGDNESDEEGRIIVLDKTILPT